MDALPSSLVGFLPVFLGGAVNHAGDRWPFQTGWFEVQVESLKGTGQGRTQHLGCLVSFVNKYEAGWKGEFLPVRRAQP